MTNQQKPAVGFVLMGLGAGLAAAGAAIVVPYCFDRARAALGDLAQKAKTELASGWDSASSALNEVAGQARHPLREAALAAKQTTALAAGAIESAARHVREHVQ